MKILKTALTDSEIEEIFPETKLNELFTIVQIQNQNFQQNHTSILIKNLSNYLSILDPELQFVQIFFRSGFDDLISEQIEMFNSELEKWHPKLTKNTS